MKYVLITGISSGIGLYLSKLISSHDFTVIGSYRNLQNIEPSILDNNRIHLIQMDVSDESSIEKAFIEIKSIIGDHGLYALINNAGIAIPGPISHLPLERIKYQFQVNVFAPIKLIQLSFDLLLKYGPGSRIINISSVSGLFAAPFLGAYAASKFALEGMSDSLRRELQRLGIKVVVIEPGPMKTLIWKKHLNMAASFEDSPFAIYLENARESILATEQNAMRLERLETPILKALQSTKPKPRYLIHKNKIRFYLLAKFLPVPLVDFLVQRNLKSGKPKIRPI